MTQLSVNVNKIATLRNARGQNQPHLISVVKDLLSYGVKSITVHPRPDERHITRQDVYEISKYLKEYNKQSTHIEFNIEGYPSKDFLSLVKEVKPDQCTLVPDPPHVLTSNAGWKCQENFDLLTQVISDLKEWKVRSSLFIEPLNFNSDELKALIQLSPNRIELYTELYAKTFNTPEQQSSLDLYKKVVSQIVSHNIKVNAGHDLNQKNLKTLIQYIPEIVEVSIGHALICESLYEGLKKTSQSYLKILNHDLA